MQNRLNSLNNSIVKSNKVPPPVKTPQPKATTPVTKGEGFHKKSIQLPKPAENPRTPLKSNSSAVSANSKNPVDKKASIKPVTQHKQPTYSQKALLSKEELKKLDDKFGELSSSVLSVATSQIPVGSRSLESLLNREVSNLLGDHVNHPEFSQGFVQSTRKLLENLVSVHEGGKLNPKLLKDRTGENKSYIRASSATTVCYRDRYFKELVMNVLQTMTSEQIEEEVTVQATHSKESKERIQLIRDMVRAEAGLEPEDFKKLEQRLEELKKSLTRNKLEVERATMEVDRIISQHTGNNETCDWQIPGPAREVLRKCNKKGDKELKSDLNKSGKGACGNEHGCCRQTSGSKDTNTGGKEQYKKSLNIIGDEECFEKGNSDEITTIRPHLKHLVHEELLRIKIKEEEILNQDRQFDLNNGLEETPKSSLESVDFKSAVSNISADDEDDESNREETRVSLEVLKTETEEKRISKEDIFSSGLQSFCLRVLESIEEDEDEVNYQENTSTTASTESKNSSSSINSSTINLQSSLDGNTEYNTSNKEEQLGEKCMIERVKSKLLNKEESDINDVLAEMTDALEIFKDMPEDVFRSFKTSEDYKKETGDGNEAAKFNSDADLYLWDFTVGEVANVLVNISIKINNLPRYFQEVSSNDSALQKEQVLDILSVLGKIIASKPMENYDIVNLDEATSTLPIKKFVKAFSVLSNTLSCSPREIKSELISVLNPPKSLVETLYALSSTTYFRDCFTSVKEYKNRQTEHLEVVKPYNINEQRSSGVMLTYGPVEDTSGGCRKKVYTYIRDLKKPDDVDKNLTNFEHFMGLSACVMTVQNVSDMFLFLSTVLNDVPRRLKTEKILNLNPPLSFLTALNILYCDEEDEEDSFTEVEKKKSFASLTIQNVSDFLLTLSKIFDDVPERLKSSVVAELSPPRTLLRAITLLTSLSHFSIAESRSQEMAETVSSENQDNFFDAVDSLSAVN